VTPVAPVGAAVSGVAAFFVQPPARKSVAKEPRIASRINVFIGKKSNHNYDENRMRKRIGEFLVEKGVLTVTQVDEILEYAQRNGLRFGKAGLEMGLLTQDQLIRVFGPRYTIDFFHLDPRYLPEATRDLLSPDQMIEFGAVPLGFKTGYRLFKAHKMLNMGFLNPARTEAIAEVERLAKAKMGENSFRGLKIFLILSDQFLDVLEQVFSITEEEIRKRDPSHVDETLHMFLEKAGH